MKQKHTIFASSPLVFLAVVLLAGGCSTADKQGDYPITPVHHADVTMTDDFWSPRMEVNREVTLPHIMQKLQQTERLKNFELAAAGSGTYCTTYPFDDTDAYKYIEAASYVLDRQYDAGLDRRVDSLITKIGAAQEADGYIYPYAVLQPNEEAGAEGKEWWWGSERWEKVHLHSHELYNAGHLIEAAVAHHKATGKDNLLDIAVRFADLITETFGPGEDQLQRIPGHQEIELALAKLYRLTGEEKYLQTAQYFLDERGKPRYNEEGENGMYKQNHKPVREQTEAEGHSVRAAYMYSGMADIGMMAGEEEYIEAIDRVWENIAGKKLYLIGGIGATGSSEGFGPNYDLPNRTSYNESCAAIANVFWNERMFRIHGDAKYIDILERALYNNVIAGHSMNGDRFFYPNRLESDGNYQRSEWFGCACCPPNLARILASVPRYMYATGDNSVYVNLFAASEARLRVGEQEVQLVQQTDYPWDGTIRIRVQPQAEHDFAMKIRIPGWARNKPVPSDLYRYRGEAGTTPRLLVNGEPQALDTEHGYATVSRQWESGDEIELQLPMDVRQVVAHDSVTADAGKIALERGPLVYSFESVDNGADVLSMQLDGSRPFSTEHHKDLLNGITTIEATAYAGGRPQTVRAIPYYAWAHRGDSRMAVWLDAYSGN